jgi:hypothetical protein
VCSLDQTTTEIDALFYLITANNRHEYGDREFCAPAFDRRENASFKQPSPSDLAPITDTFARCNRNQSPAMVRSRVVYRAGVHWSVVISPSIGAVLMLTIASMPVDVRSVVFPIEAVFTLAVASLWN